MSTKTRRKRRAIIRRLAETDITNTMMQMVATLYRQGVEIPCTITVEDRAVRWIVTATKSSRAVYDGDTADHVFLIHVGVKAERMERP